MLAFIDESGDTGLRTDEGASRFFVVVMVLFEDHEEALRCDQRISLLRAELGYADRFELHFRENSDRQRKRFLEAVAPYDFQYFGFALNKGSEKLWGPGFEHKASLYKFTCGIVFENAKPYLTDAIVVLDESGTDTFRSQLSKYLGRRMTTAGGMRLIKKIKMQRSAGNNLLQLADYVAGVVSRKVQRKKKEAAEHYRYIAAKEVMLRVWPE